MEYMYKGLPKQIVNQFTDFTCGFRPGIDITPVAQTIAISMQG